MKHVRSKMLNLQTRRVRVNTLISVDVTVVTLFHLLFDFAVLMVTLEIASGVRISFDFLLSVFPPHKAIIKKRRHLDHQFGSVLRTDRTALIFRLLRVTNNGFLQLLRGVGLGARDSRGVMIVVALVDDTFLFLGFSLSISGHNFDHLLHGAIGVATTVVRSTDSLGLLASVLPPFVAIIFRPRSGGDKGRCRGVRGWPGVRRGTIRMMQRRGAAISGRLSVCVGGRRIIIPNGS